MSDKPSPMRIAELEAKYRIEWLNKTITIESTFGNGVDAEFVITAIDWNATIENPVTLTKGAIIAKFKSKQGGSEGWYYLPAALDDLMYYGTDEMYGAARNA